MSEVKKCPKCGGRMKAGKVLARYGLVKHYDLVFENAGQRKLVTKKQWVISYACVNCGYLETYVEGTRRSIQPKQTYFAKEGNEP